MTDDRKMMMIIRYKKSGWFDGLCVRAIIKGHNDKKGRNQAAWFAESRIKMRSGPSLICVYAYMRMRVRVKKADDSKRE